MHFDHLRHDGQAKSGSRGGRSGPAIEPVEHTRALIFRNPRAGVFNTGFDICANAADLYGHCASFRRIADRVVHQIV